MEKAARDAGEAPAPLGRAVLVLGMHRSGTSCLTGCLEECGLALGEVNRAAPHNLRGNQEDPRIWELHDELLAANGGGWDRPPERLAWSDEHRRRRDEILDGYRALPVFGIKDPRMLVTLPLWLEALAEAAFVGTFRHPLAVARSLARRNGFPMARGLELWATYNRLLLARRRELGFDLVCFDLPQAEYLASVRRAARRLGLRPPEDPGGMSFFDPELRRDAEEVGAPPDGEVAGLYAELRRLAL